MLVFTKNIAESPCWSTGKSTSNLRLASRSNSWSMSWYCSWFMFRPTSSNWEKRHSFSWHWEIIK
jgi:hypothetical protein